MLRGGALARAGDVNANDAQGPVARLIVPANRASARGCAAARVEAVGVGVGGFKVPLAQDYDSADLARELALPVILVVRLGLGCINHALPSVEAIERRARACSAGQHLEQAR